MPLLNVNLDFDHDLLCEIYFFKAVQVFIDYLLKFKYFVF